MEQLTLSLGNDRIYDDLVHKASFSQASDITIASKDNCTMSGRPGVVISFAIDVNGTKKNVQAVTTLACLTAAFHGLKGRYGPGGPQAHRYPGNSNPFI